MINLTNILKNKDSLLINVSFYFLSSLFVVAIFGYFILAMKVSVQIQRADEANKRMINFGFYQQKTDEQKVIDYKKKIDDFDLVIKSHKISSNIFAFIEENTLPNIWFSNFNMSQFTNDLKLSGEAKNMETLVHQIQIFEKNKDQVEEIKVLNSQFNTNDKISFTLNISLNPKIYTYNP